MGILETGEGVQIHPTAEISAEMCYLGDRTVVGENVVIEGHNVHIGKEGWLDRGAHIGGGSCFDPGSRLTAGDFLHMGMGSHINIARKVEIGDEVGIGRGTQIFTHGAYLSCLDGFPVQWGNVIIEDRVWLPHAWVNPGVIIESDVVVAAMTLLQSGFHAPSGCLIGGIPADIIKHNVYPHKSLEPWVHLQHIVHQTNLILGVSPGDRNVFEFTFHPAVTDTPHPNQIIVDLGKGDPTVFNIDERTIKGEVNIYTIVLKNQLRRNGIRFRYKEDEDGQYVPW